MRRCLSAIAMFVCPLVTFAQPPDKLTLPFEPKKPALTVDTSKGATGLTVTGKDGKTVTLPPTFQPSEITLPFGKPPTLTPGDKGKPSLTTTESKPEEMTIPLDVPTKTELVIIQNAPKRIYREFEEKAKVYFQGKHNEILTRFQGEYAYWYRHYSRINDRVCFISRVNGLKSKYRQACEDLERDHKQFLRSGPPIHEQFNFPLIVGRYARRKPPTASFDPPITPETLGGKTVYCVSGGFRFYFRELNPVSDPLYMVTGWRKIEGKVVFIIDALEVGAIGRVGQDN